MVDHTQTVPKAHFAIFGIGKSRFRSQDRSVSFKSGIEHRRARNVAGFHFAPSH
jgi:hypothetical protein